jgi:Fe-S cluster assembly protein SufD
MATPLAEKVSREYAAVAPRLPAFVVSTARRRAAIDEILARGLPSARDENWRYANLRVLDRTTFAPAEAVSDTLAARLPDPIAGFTRLLVIDGVLRDALTDDATGVSAQHGLSVRSLRARAGSAGGAAAPPLARLTTGADADERFALLNEAFALDEIEIEIATRAGRATPGLEGSAVPSVELVYLSSGQGATYPRVRIEAAAGTRLRLLEHHLGGAVGGLTNAVTEIAIGRGASVDHFRIQRQEAEATWLDTLDVVVNGAGQYSLQQYGVGARAARSTIRVRLAEPQASVVFHSAIIAEAQQVQDVYARVEHAAPDTRSVENFRALATGRGRVAFNGHVVVRPGAHGADSRQSLRSLIAGSEAEVDARPQLEIYNDDVKCSHGATAGKLDEAMLFYMLARGLAPETARSLLKWAFLADTVAHIGDVGVRLAIERVLAEHLKDPTIAAGRRE